MDAALHFRPRVEHALEDVALDYVENEVGRHDWSANWQKLKQKHPDMKSKIQAWLQRYEIDHDPQGLIDFLDRMVTTRPGKWK